MAYPIPRAEIEKTMAEGAMAFASGLKPFEGPYSKFSDLGRLWLRGYSNAYYGQMQFDSKNIDFWKNSGN